MVREVSEEKFSAPVISAGRVTIPSHIQEKLGLAEGDTVQVKLSKGNADEKRRRKTTVLVGLDGRAEMVDNFLEMIRESAENVFVILDIDYEA